MELSVLGLSEHRRSCDRRGQQRHSQGVRSNAAGAAVQRAAGEQFVATNLELGGKDPAYVRPDARLEATIENLVDGAYFNAGQSCCAVERIYVHRDISRS